MKKFFWSCVAAALIGVATIYVALSKKFKQLSDLQSANIEVLATDEHPSGGSSEIDCFSVTNNCWFWNCSTVYRCSVTDACPAVSCDDYSSPGKCYP